MAATAWAINLATINIMGKVSSVVIVLCVDLPYKCASLANKTLRLLGKPGLIVGE